MDPETDHKLRQAEILLIGCSAGGFNLVFELLISMPADFPVAVIVVIHRSRKYKSTLEELLHKKANLKVKLAEDKERIKRGYIYFAPPDYHLLLEPDGLLTLDDSEPVFFCRPSIDITFESVTDVFKDKVIGILLSGANEDGANGICYIEKNGGLAIVQDPLHAEVSTMPQSAISKCNPSLIMKNEELFELIQHITTLKNKALS